MPSTRPGPPSRQRRSLRPFSPQAKRIGGDSFVDTDHLDFHFESPTHRANNAKRVASARVTRAFAREILRCAQDDEKKRGTATSPCHSELLQRRISTDAPAAGSALREGPGP